MSTLRIAVDVTPIRAGGECGGAKPFVLELLKGMAAATRRHDYLLLTAGHNDDDVAAADDHRVAATHRDALALQQRDHARRRAGRQHCAALHQQPGVDRA